MKGRGLRLGQRTGILEEGKRGAVKQNSYLIIIK